MLAGRDGEFPSLKYGLFDPTLFTHFGMRPNLLPENEPSCSRKRLLTRNQKGGYGIRYRGGGAARRRHYEIEEARNVFARDRRQARTADRFGPLFSTGVSGDAEQRRAPRARLAGWRRGRQWYVLLSASQAGRWELLERAAAIDRKAANESVSWGARAGDGCTLGMARGLRRRRGAGRRGARVPSLGQARLMARFIEKIRG